jgi:hypothetical protein
MTATMTTTNPEGNMNKLLNEVLQYLQMNGYRRASFDRLCEKLACGATYQQLEDLVDEYPEIFRTSNIKGGRPGLALLDDVSIQEAIEMARPPVEEEVPPMPLVTSFSMEEEIVDDYYRNLGSAIKAPEGSPAYNTTLCILVLRNGFVIVGKSACVYSENFNEDTGKRLAREDALRQIGPFMGWREADKRALLSGAI